MFNLQQQLVARYKTLCDMRVGPVFFIEHGLSIAEINALAVDIRTNLNLHPLDSEWWDIFSLPLIVLVTEVGYRYQGSGTDFWPELEDELSVHISGAERLRIRDLFAAAAKAFRGVHPPATPWAEAFHLIAWPITHALVPIEFHRSLALTLANLRVNISGLDDDSLHRAIKFAAVSSSGRFATLLENASIAVSVVRSLLGAETKELCQEVILRIADDLAQDYVADRSIAVARRIQKGVSSRGPKSPKFVPFVSNIKGKLKLSRRDDALSLEASFPTIDPQAFSDLRKVLRRLRFAPKLWGVTSRVSSEQLLSGLPFALRFESPPSVDIALLPGLEDLNIEEDHREILNAFELRLISPMLFAVGSDNEVAQQVRGTSISGHRLYWVLTSEPSSLLSRFPTLGDIGPYICFELDPREKDACQVLTDLGYKVQFGVSVAFAGTPMLYRNASSPAYLIGDYKVVVPQCSCPDGMLVELGDNAINLYDDEMAHIVITPGEHLLRVTSRNESREFSFRGVMAPEPLPFSVCKIATQSSELTVQELLKGRLAFTIESFAPLEGLELTVEFEAAGRRLSATAPLGPLPQTVTSEKEPLATLLEDDTIRNLLLQTPNPTVHLRVGNLCACSWVLEQRIQPVWWVQDPEGVVKLKGELGDLLFGEVSSAGPHLPPNIEPMKPIQEAKLFAPVGLDNSVYGDAALFTTLCIAPSRIRLGVPVGRKPRLKRCRRSNERNTVGLEDLLEAYLRWSLAETKTLIAEMRRRQITDEIDAWVVELCCGEVWADHEANLKSIDPWELLTQILDETSLGRDSYVELSREDEIEVTRLSVAEIRRVQPGLWSRIGPPNDLTANDYEVLDLSCSRAYCDLADQYLKLGREDLATEIAEGDPGAAEDDWDEVLTRAKAQSDLISLAALLLPTDTALQLMTLDVSGMSLDDLTEELGVWGKKNQKALACGVPAMETIKAVLALWVEPEVATVLDWRGALDTMIVERSVARAARYLALKSRHLRRGGVA